MVLLFCVNGEWIGLLFVWMVFYVCNIGGDGDERNCVRCHEKKILPVIHTSTHAGST